MFTSLPRLGYNLSREFPWRIELLVYSFILIVAGLLIPLNIAKAGYDTVTVLQSNYTWVPHHWYYKFMSPPKTPCDAYSLTLGDSITTNSSIFPWTITSIFNPNQTTRSINPSNTVYNGWTTDVCDVTYISLVLDSKEYTSTIAAEVTCFPDPQTSKSKYNLVMSASASFGWTFTTKIGNGQSAFGDLQYDAWALLDAASQDALSNMLNVTTVAGDSTSVPTYIAVDTQADTISCIPDQSTSCTSDPPTITLNPSIMISSTAHILNSTEIAALCSDYQAPIKNFMQIMLALVRIDFGRSLPNNLISNSSIIDQVIAQSYTVRGVPLSNTQTKLYLALTDPDGVGSALQADPKSQLGQIFEPFDVQYTCHDKKLKNALSLVIAVAVATLSLGLTIYGLVLRGLAFLAKSQTRANEDMEARGALPSMARKG